MNKEEAIEQLNLIKNTLVPMSAEGLKYVPTLDKALTMAIEALEHKPSSEGGKSAKEVLNSKFTMDWPMGMPYMDIYDAMKEYAKQFQPPVISDEEIQIENYRRFDLTGSNGTFNDGAVWMRKLLTNKEY